MGDDEVVGSDFDPVVLTERSARVAGYSVASDWDPELYSEGVWVSDQDRDGLKYYPRWIPWSPLTDDVAYAGLEARLGLDVAWDLDGGSVKVFWRGRTRVVFFSDHGGDKMAARRFAGVTLVAGFYL